MGRHFHFDKEQGKVVEGLPPYPNNFFGQAPMVIQDTTSWYYHPAAGQWTDSKKAIKDFDKATGCITTDKRLPPDPSQQNRLNKERHDDLHKSMHRAVAQIDAGTAPLTEETKELCKIQNKIAADTLGFDAFNVAGKKNDSRGKKYRK